MDDLAQRVKALREQRGWTQEDLESASGVVQSHISRLEANKTPQVSGMILARVARALETTTDYLLGLTDNPRLPPSPETLNTVGRAAQDPRFAYLGEMWGLLPGYAQDHLHNQVRLMEKLNPDLRRAMRARGIEPPEPPPDAPKDIGL